MSIEQSKKRNQRNGAYRFWTSIPKASDIKITRADGTVEYQKVNNKAYAAKVIRKAKS
jgi:hypothetical protein